MKPFFLSVGDGFRFYVYRPARRNGEQAPGLIYVPPFAEEMNKCRHMAASAARSMADRGIAVLIPDLAGCGDSSGEFGEADLSLWRDDIARAADWLASEGHKRLSLWGVRLGALLAADFAAASPGRFERCLFWQPVTSGEIAITQFLRLRIAAEMLSGQAASATLAAMRSDLAAGRPVEVAGYLLAPALADGLSRLKLAELNPKCDIDWIEIATDPTRGLMAASVQVAEKWEASGTIVRTAVVQGVPFWAAGNNEDVVDCVSVLNSTIEIVEAWHPS